ncbi:MAG: hypothetical protein IKO11_03615, partial [Lachnospiraceae bacterium]|nr:hypothetical protein [Lachnospiraceae bacterium]
QTAADTQENAAHAAPNMQMNAAQAAPNVQMNAAQAAPNMQMNAAQAAPNMQGNPYMQGNPAAQPGADRASVQEGPTGPLASETPQPLGPSPSVPAGNGGGASMEAPAGPSEAGSLGPVTYDKPVDLSQAEEPGDLGPSILEREAPKALGPSEAVRPHTAPNPFLQKLEEMKEQEDGEE